MSEIRKSVCIRVIDSDQIVEDISFRSIVDLPLDDEKDRINSESNNMSLSAKDERKMARERTSGLAGKGATLKAHTHTRIHGPPDKQSDSATTSSGMGRKKARERTQREMAMIFSSTPAKHQTTNERTHREMAIIVDNSTPAKHLKSNRHTLSEISTNSSHSQLHGNATSSRGRSCSNYSSIVAESSPANPSPPGKFFMMETSSAKQKENDEGRVSREEVSMTDVPQAKQLVFAHSSRKLSRSKYDASVTKKPESNFYHERRQNDISRNRNRMDAPLANLLQEENGHENDAERKKTTRACQCGRKTSSSDYDYGVLEMEQVEGKRSNWHVGVQDSRGRRRPSQEQEGGGISCVRNDEHNILSFLGRRTALFRPSTQLWVEDEVLKIYMEAKRRDRETPSFHHHKIESQNAAFLYGTDSRNAALLKGRESQNVTFQYGTDSRNATFLYETDSQNATFQHETDSRNATFQHETDSRNATFQHETDSRNATFQHETDSRNATLLYETDSQNATFLKKRESELQNATVLYDTESKHNVITHPLETE